MTASHQGQVDGASSPASRHDASRTPVHNISRGRKLKRWFADRRQNSEDYSHKWRLDGGDVSCTDTIQEEKTPHKAREG